MYNQDALVEYTLHNTSFMYPWGDYMSMYEEVVYKHKLVVMSCNYEF